MSLFPQYAKPRTIEQATQVLAGLGSGGMVIAGGQELLPSMNYGRLELEVIVDINGLDEMRGITADDGQLDIGALSVHRELQDSDLVQQHAPLLAAAAAQVGGGLQVHNRGTIGGNIVSMHPLYDIIPPLLVLGASATLSDTNGTRTLPLADLMQDTSHGLGVSALLTRVTVPFTSTDTGWAYQKLKTTHGAYGSANAAATVTLSGNHVGAVTLAIGGAADQAVPLTTQLSDLEGTAVSAATAEIVAERASAAIEEPLSDHQGAADYRRAMAGVMAQRAFLAAAAMAGAKI